MRPDVPAMFREKMESVGQPPDKNLFIVLPSDEWVYTRRAFVINQRLPITKSCEQLSEPRLRDRFPKGLCQ